MLIKQGLSEPRSLSFACLSYLVGGVHGPSFTTTANHRGLYSLTPAIVWNALHLSPNKVLLVTLGLRDWYHLSTTLQGEEKFSAFARGLAGGNTCRAGGGAKSARLECLHAAPLSASFLLLMLVLSPGLVQPAASGPPAAQDGFGCGPTHF